MAGDAEGPCVLELKGTGFGRRCGLQFVVGFESEVDFFCLCVFDFFLGTFCI